MKLRNVEKLIISCLIILIPIEIICGLNFFEDSTRYIYSFSFGGICIWFAILIYKKPKSVVKQEQMIMFFFLLLSIIKPILFGKELEWLINYFITGIIAILGGVNFFKSHRINGLD